MYTKHIQCATYWPFYALDETLYLLPIETYIGKDHTISDDWKKAVFQTSIQMVKELAIAVHKFHTQYPEDKKVSPLFISAQQGNLQLTQYLIGKGVDKNWNNTKGLTPLFMAAKNGYLEVYRLIMEGVVDKNPASNIGVTPLYVAAQNGHYEICKLIMDNVLDKNPAANNGATPLFMAALKVNTFSDLSLLL